jgi:serine/threonine-protein kinase
MVTEKGVVKIMDFGLAKLSNRSRMTLEGSTVGTAAYMSPEQAQGQTVDHRSDIWSLGVVLYEMISGQVPFKGDYESAVIYGILHDEPEPLTAIRTGVPIELDGIIAKALAKDPDTRYQHVDELPADLKAIDTSALSRSRRTPPAAESTVSGTSKLAFMPWIIVTVMTIISISVLWYALSNESNSKQNISGIKRFTMPLTPADEAIGLSAISPDGRTVVFFGETEDFGQIYYRSLDSDVATPLPGTELGYSPFFSPDGRWIGFITKTALWKTSVDGGLPKKICNLENPVHASWGDNNEIVFDQPLSEQPWQLMRVSANGGQSEKLILAEPETPSHAYWPEFLPGGKAILYESSSDWGNPNNSSIHVHALATGETRTVIQSGSNPYYASTGHIIYVLSGNLMAVPFDPESLTIHGEPVMIIKGILFDPVNHYYNYSISPDGTLLYVKSAHEGGTNLVWVDRKGNESYISAKSHHYWDPRISPDGRRLAVHARDERNDIWVYDLERGSLYRLTHKPGEDETPLWSPDGRWIAFASSHGGINRSIFRTLSDGSGGEELLWTGDQHIHVDSWSPDGKSIVLTYYDPKTNQDLWILNLEGEPATKPLWETAYSESNARISPNGRWISYESDESGQREIYVQAFPELGNKVLVSTKGGIQAVWSSDGKELFYRGEGSIMAVKVKSDNPLSFSAPRALFPDHYYLNTLDDHIGYSISKDGERFLMLKREPQTHITHLEVVLNWFEEVKRLAPLEN